jgi:hypothetical protein
MLNKVAAFIAVKASSEDREKKISVTPVLPTWK